MRKLFVLGISLLTFLFIASCGRTEYLAKASFVYKNETDYLISYNRILNSDTSQMFTIAPKSEKVLTFEGGGADKQPTIENCCEGFLESTQGIDAPILVIFENLRCIVYLEGDGSTTTNLLNGYEAEQLTDRSFKFTFTFTEADYQNAVPCN